MFRGRGCLAYVRRLGVAAAVALVALAASQFARSAPTSRPTGDGWTVLFRADDPLLWGKDAGNPADSKGFARHLGAAPADMKFARLTRLDTGDVVIVPLTLAQLDENAAVGGELMWSAGSKVRGKADRKNKLLGIARRDWSAAIKNEHLVARTPGKMDTGYRGWGFSKEARTTDQVQTYTWAGEPIGKTVFEIAVKAEPLTADEQARLLTARGATAGATTVAMAGPTTRLARRQSSIHALYVMTQNTGQLLGVSSELILTAWPGSPARGNKIPISFTSKAGGDMHLVLDDVVRAVNVKYPRVEAEKLELSFADKYTPKDGGSIGAAIGVLILSVIQGFDVDTKVAITGDVTADAKLRRIGGVDAKIRGATAAGCDIVALPTENYDQVVDCMVYEGIPFIAATQVIGAANLDEAVVVARVDRDAKLADAMKSFAEVRELIKRSPERLRSKDVQSKLSAAVEAYPNHYSAKLLLLAAQEKQAKRLSATASQYYTFVAVNKVMPAVFDRARAKQQLPAATIQQGLRDLERVRRITDPKMLPLIDALRNFMRELNEAANGRGSQRDIETRAQAVQDAMAKVETDRDLMQKMLNEGI